MPCEGALKGVGGGGGGEGPTTMSPAGAKGLTWVPAMGADKGYKSGVCNGSGSTLA